MAERASGKSGKRKERPGDFDKGARRVGRRARVRRWLALPKDSDLQRRADAGAISADAGATDPAPKAAGHAGAARRSEHRARGALRKSEVDVAKLASAEAIAKLLDIRHCGGACDAVKKLMLDHDHFEVEVMKSEDYILPPKDSFATIAPGLTASERASISDRATTVVVRTRGVPDIDQLPARTAFAATAALAESAFGARLRRGRAAHRDALAVRRARHHDAARAERVLTAPDHGAALSPGRRHRAAPHARAWCASEAPTSRCAARRWSSGPRSRA